jgi:hypothetical protein
MTETKKAHCYQDKTPDTWQEFLAAMQSGQTFECDEAMFNYWLEVLPPAHMGRNVVLPNGDKVRAAFGFAEGQDFITVFWSSGGRYFGCRTNTRNL